MGPTAPTDPYTNYRVPSMRASRVHIVPGRRTNVLVTVLGLAAVFATFVAVAGAADHRITFGHSVHGTKLVATRIGDPDAKRTGLVVGSIHGDETEGHEIVHTLKRRYRDAKHVKLWVVKTVNPDGVAANMRKNARGVDLNRNFAYRWEGGVPPSSGYYPGPHPFSEPESRAVKRLVKRIRPNVTVWYHQPWGQVLLPCHGPAGVQRRYADLADWPTKRCRGQHLHGTATRWQNHHFRGQAFVVELNAGELPDSAARRHARAAVKVVRSGARRSGTAGSKPAAEPAKRSAQRRSKLKRPPIKADPIPYGHKRKHQMARYSKRHYGQPRWHLRDPKVIVLHFTAGPSYQSAWQVFASNAPNNGELPGVCSHFVVDQDGTAYRTVRPSIRCRHAIGLNYTAIGVEMVQETGSGSHWADEQILHRHKQIHKALRLVGWLKQQNGIKMRNIIGHAMANQSPFFKDLEGWRNDHTDWLKRDVKTFRQRLHRLLAR